MISKWCSLLALEDDDEAEGSPLSGNDDHGSESYFASLAVGILEHTSNEY